MADSRIGIGFIGCGDVALRSYVPGMAAVSDLATTVAVYDADPARAERLADDLAARRFPRPRVVPTLAALLTDPDVSGVFNLTPAPFHYDVNVAALSAGKHLFTEKPLAGTVPNAKSITTLANERGLTFLSAPAVMATNRFRWLKQQIESGWLGRPTLAVAQMANMGPASWRDYGGSGGLLQCLGRTGARHRGLRAARHHRPLRPRKTGGSVRWYHDSAPPGANSRARR